MELYEPRPRERAREHLEAYVLQNQLKAREALPPERELCQLWGISRSTLRSAIAQLCDAGHLSALQGSGTFRRPRIQRNLQDLESFSSFAEKLGMRPESLLLSFSRISADAGLSREFSGETGLSLYQIVRLRSLGVLPLQIETSCIPESLAPGLEAHDLVGGSLYQILEQNYGLQAWQGWEKVSVTAASPEEARYLNIPEKSTVFWLVSKTYTADGQLLESCRTVGRSDLLEFFSCLRRRERHDNERP